LKNNKENYFLVKLREKAFNLLN